MYKLRFGCGSLMYRLPALLLALVFLPLPLQVLAASPSVDDNEATDKGFPATISDFETLMPDMVVNVKDALRSIRRQVFPPQLVATRSVQVEQAFEVERTKYQTVIEIDPFSITKFEFPAEIRQLYSTNDHEGFTSRSEKEFATIITSLNPRSLNFLVLLAPETAIHLSVRPRQLSLEEAERNRRSLSSPTFTIDSISLARDGRLLLRRKVSVENTAVLASAENRATCELNLRIMREHGESRLVHPFADDGEKGCETIEPVVVPTAAGCKESEEQAISSGYYRTPPLGAAVKVNRP